MRDESNINQFQSRPHHKQSIAYRSKGAESINSASNSSGDRWTDSAFAQPAAPRVRLRCRPLMPRRASSGLRLAKAPACERTRGASRARRAPPACSLRDVRPRETIAQKPRSPPLPLPHALQARHPNASPGSCDKKCKRNIRVCTRICAQFSQVFIYFIN